MDDPKWMVQNPKKGSMAQNGIGPFVSEERPRRLKIGWLRLWLATQNGCQWLVSKKRSSTRKLNHFSPHQSLSTSPGVLPPLPLHPSSCYLLYYWPPCCHIKALFPPTKVCLPFSLQYGLSDTLSQLFPLLLYVSLSCGDIYWSQSVLGTFLAPPELIWALFWLCTRYVGLF